jgi:RND family efflux transporter MFP subunit
MNQDMKGDSVMLRVLLAAFLSCVLTASGCEEEKVQPKTVLRPVRTITVGGTDIGRLRTFSGTAQAGQEWRLSFKVPGTVKRMAVKVGDRVKKGAVIAELDSKDYDLQVEQARASLAQAQAQLRNAQATFKRTRELYANRNASKSEFDAARAASETAQAGVRAASKQVQLLRQQRGYTRMASPAAGSIAEVKVEVNENVTVGKVVVILNAGDDLEVRVAVPEVVIARIKKGNPVKVRFDALPGKEFSGTVDEVGVSSTGAGSTYPLTIKLKETDKAIRAGMAAEVVFEFAKKDASPRILIPAVAVGEDRKGRFVYLVTPGEAGTGVVKRRKVSVGELTSEGLEITGGLADGDIVVTAGLSFLEEDRQVKMPESEAGK